MQDPNSFLRIAQVTSLRKLKLARKQRVAGLDYFLHLYALCSSLRFIEVKVPQHVPWMLTRGHATPVKKEARDDEWKAWGRGDLNTSSILWLTGKL